MVKRCPKCNEVVKPPYKKCDNCGYSPGGSKRDRKRDRAKGRKKGRKKRPSDRRKRGKRPSKERKRKRRPSEREERGEKKGRSRRGGKRRKKPPRDKKRSGKRGRKKRPSRDKKRRKRPSKEEKRRGKRGRRRKPRKEERERKRPAKKRGRPGKRRGGRRKKKGPEYDPAKDPKIKEFDEEIEGFEEELNTLRQSAEDMGIALENLEKEKGGLQEKLDEYLEEKELIKRDIQEEMSCPKCGTAVVLPETSNKTLHLNCDDCGSKGRLTNPNIDEYLDLEDVDRDIEEVEHELDGFEKKVLDAREEIDDAELKVKSLEEDILMKKEEKEDHIEEMKRSPEKWRKRIEEKEEEEKARVEEDFEEDLFEEEEEDIEEVDEDAFCPMCYGDLEPPFTSCSACGWEAEEDYSDAASSLDEYEEEEVDDFGDTFERAGTYDPGDRRRAAEEHYQVPCRCGATIDIWTSKRPTKIKCDGCGAKGVLKSMGKKVTDDLHGEYKYESPDDYGDEPAYKDEPEPERRRGGRRGRKRGKKRGGDKRRGGRGEKGMEEIEEEAFNILFKLEKMLDDAAQKDMYFPEIEDEIDYLEEDIELARSPGDLKDVIRRAKKMGNKVYGQLKR